MNELEKVSVLRQLKVLEKQIEEAVANCLFNSDADLKKRNAENTVELISNIIKHGYFDRSIISDYQVSPPVFPTGKAVTTIIGFRRGKRRPVYAANILFPDMVTYTIKVSRSLRIVKVALKRFGIDNLFLCDISVKPTQPVEYITFNLKVSKNA